MRQQLLGGLKKSNCVRQLRVQFERGLIYPLRMNCEHKRLSERFKKMNSHTTNLGSRRLEIP